MRRVFKVQATRLTLEQENGGRHQQGTQPSVQERETKLQTRGRHTTKTAEGLVKVKARQAPSPVLWP